MSFLREGYAFMAASGAIAFSVMAAASWRRSWSLWVLGFLALVITAWVAWIFRRPLPAAPAAAAVRSAATATATADTGRGGLTRRPGSNATGVASAGGFA